MSVLMSKLRARALSGVNESGAFEDFRSMPTSASWGSGPLSSDTFLQLIQNERGAAAVRSWCCCVKLRQLPGNMWFGINVLCCISKHVTVKVIALVNNEPRNWLPLLWLIVGIEILGFLGTLPCCIWLGCYGCAFSLAVNVSKVTIKFNTILLKLKCIGMEWSCTYTKNSLLLLPSPSLGTACFKIQPLKGSKRRGHGSCPKGH